MPNPVRRLHHRTLALINRAIDGLAEGAQGGGDAPGRRDPRAQGARMRFEPLEQRLLMSADLLPGLTTALTGSNPDGAISLVTYADEAGEAQARITLQANGQPSQAFVDTLDTDDFSTPLQPLSPRGSLVFAGGVQGSLAATGDADSLHIELEAGQLFALRFQTTDADSDLRARVEVFDAADRSLGFVEAGQAGDGLSLQQLAGADGATRIEVSALAGSGAYKVELFLNAVLEATDGSSIADAVDLTPVLTPLPGGSGSRASVIGALNAPASPLLRTGEDFETDLGTRWALSSTNPDATFERVNYYYDSSRYALLSEGDYSGYGGYGPSETGLGTEAVGDYADTLNEAVLTVDLTGAQDLQLDFDYWGHDPVTDAFTSTSFIGSQNADGVAISVDGTTWYPLITLDTPDDWGPNHATLDLSAALAANGLVANGELRIKFQHFDQPYTDTNGDVVRGYRYWDNIRISEVRSLAHAPTAGVTATGDVQGDLASLSDGVLLAEGTQQRDNRSVYWFGEGEVGGGEIGAAAQAPATHLDFDLGSVVTLSDLQLSLDGNDDYLVEYSADGLSWSTLLQVDRNQDGEFYWGLDTLSTVRGDAEYDESLDFAAVQARYLRLTGTGSNDNLYAVSELRALTATSEADVDDWYRLDLAAGESASVALQLAQQQDTDTVGLELYTADGRLLTLGRGVADADLAIAGFKAPATGSYYLRVSGTVSSEYNLAVTRDAVLGSAASGTQDITATPVVVDSFIAGSGGGTGSIRVAVHSGDSSLIASLNDSTAFDIEAVSVTGSQIDTLDELRQYDVVIIGDPGTEGEFASLAPALRQWVEAGGGLVATGWTVYGAGPTSGPVVPDLDAVVPVGTSSYYNYIYGGTLDVLDTDHPIVDGLNDFVLPSSYYEYSQLGVDPGATALATLNGAAVVVAGNPGQGRSAYLGPTYFYNGNLRTPELDRLLEQAVAWTSGNGGRSFTLAANAGDDLVFTATPLGLAAGEPAGDLAPLLELTDEAGTVLASSTTGTLSYTAAVTGTLRLNLSADSGAGGVILRAAGSTAAAATGFGVRSTSIDSLTQATAFPGYVEVEFEEPVLLTGLSADALTVGGTAAASFELLSATRVRFFIGNTYDGDGSYTASLADGALTDIHGNALEAWSHSFLVDETLPVVTATSIARHGSIDGSPTTLSITFSEPLDTTYLDQYDSYLVDLTTNTSVSLTSFSYDSETNTLTLGLPELADGSYRLTLASGYYAFKDLLGHPLNGGPSDPLPSGQGDNTADDFQLDFIVDRAARSLGTLTVLAPLGSLVHGGSTESALNGVADVDSYAINVEAGQLLSVAALNTRAVADLQIRLSVYDRNDVLVATVDGTAGEGAALQSVQLVDGGDYRIDVENLSGEGAYRLRVNLGAAIEDETLRNAYTNDSIATAQDLSGSFVSLGNGGSRGAVTGLLLVTTPDDGYGGGGYGETPSLAVAGVEQESVGDYYRLALTADQSATFALSWSQAGASGDLRLELLSADGTVLAVGTQDAGSGAWSIRDFKTPAAGDYYLRVGAGVGGAGEGEYTLVATRTLAFELPLPGTGSLGQDIGETGQVLGHLSFGGSSGGSGAIRVAVFNAGGGDGVVNQLNDDSHYDFTATSVSAAQIDTVEELNQFDVVIIGDSYSTQLYDSFSAALREWVEAGGGLVATGWTVYAAGSATPPVNNDINAVVPVDTSVYYNYQSGGTVDVLDDTHPATAGLSDFALSTYAEYSSSGADAGSQVLATLNGRAFAVVGLPASGRSAYLGAVYYHSSLGGDASLDRLLEQTVAWAAGDRDDNYVLSVRAGDVVELSTTTPGDAAGQPANTLDLRVEVYDAAGNLLTAADGGAADGRNVQLSYTAAAAGELRVRVVAQSGDGAYVLLASGATGERTTRPTVTATTPTEGQVLAGSPHEIVVQLSEGVRADSVAAADLVLDSGGTVTGVELLAGNRLRFLIEVPDVEGTVSWHLDEGAFNDLQGNASVAYAGSFVFDLHGPRVAASSPAADSGSPFNTWIFTFSEAIDPATVNVNDIAVFTGPAGQNLRGNIYSVVAEGNTLTVRFYDQYAAGAYTMVLGPDIRDLAGNQMDQDADGLAGESGDDRYSATVTVRSPDLVTTAVSATTTAAFGSPITVAWTVTNNGNDAARAAYWYDRIVLSRDQTVGGDDILLSDQYIDADPLEAGASYTRSASINLPINVNFGNGTYYILVQSDGYNYQPENDNGNNTAASNAVAISVPPLPDLTVENVTVPAVVEAGKPTTVTWTLHNQGTAATAGGWWDAVYLSTDPSYSSGDIYVGEFYTNTPIAAGATLERSVNVNIPTSRTGTWYVVVRGDAYDYLEEYDKENNNNAASASTVNVVVATEDLTPTVVSAPAAATFGQAVTVEWTVRNAGTGPTLNNWYDRVWLSTDGTLGSGDVYLGEFYSGGDTPLAAGGQYDRSREVTLPLNASVANGTYYILVETDHYGGEPETNEANNVRASGAITMAVPPTPDLTVSGVTVPAGARAGDTVAIRFTMTNQGTAAASSFYYRLSLGDTNVAGAEDVSLGVFNFDDTLDPGESVEVTQNVTLPISSPGAWYVGVAVDSYNHLYEHGGENNNNAFSSLSTFPLPPLADLVVTNIVAPVDASSGQTVPVSWTVANQGTKNITGGTWVDRVYLSLDGGASDNIYIGDFTFEGNLAAGASVTRTQNIALPANQQGNYTVVVYTDTYDQHYEHTGENNNRKADDGQMHATFPPLPNLQVTAITPPTDAASSTNTAVSWVVTNTGTGATSSPYWVDDVWLSLNTVLGDGDDIYLGQASNPSYLAAGESYASTLNFTVPRGLSGDYYLLVRTDTYNNVFENQSEGDNTRPSVLTHFTLTPPPDLQVQSVQAPASAFSGQPMALSWTVVNAGSGRTPESSWYDRVFISDDAVFDAGDAELTRVWHNGALNAEATYTVTQNVNLPVGRVGDHWFFVVTDAGNAVYEHVNESNNSGGDTTPTDILLTPPPDLEVTTLSAPATGRAGDALSFQYVVTNLGSSATAESYWNDAFYLSADAVLDASDLLLGNRGHGGALQVDASYGGSVSLTLPNTLAGSYYLIAHADSGKQVFEGFPGAGGDPDANNVTVSATPIVIANRPANLSIESFSAPTTGESGKQVAVSWTVRNTGTGSTQASYWTDAVYASRDAIIGDDDDFVLYSTTPGDTIGVGGSYTHNALVSLPFGMETGNYTIYVRTDVDNQVYEGTGEGDNLASGSIAVTRRTPDLRVTAITAPTGDVIGGPLSLSWHVENQGQNRTDGNYWYDQVFLSQDQTLGSGDISLGSWYRNAALAGGQGYDATASYNLPAGLAAGDYYLIVRTDSYGYVTEGEGETNNVAVSAGTVYVAPTVLRPDLQVGAVDAAATAISGQSLDVTWTVRNDGVDPTGNRNWYDAVYLSRDLVFDRGTDLYLGYADHAGELAAGGSYTQTRSFNVPLGQSGPFYVFVVTDSGAHVAEVIEGNNTAYDSGFTQVSLAPPADLVVGDITIPANGIPGQSATLTYTVNNQGSNPALGSWRDSVYLSTDDVWDIGDVLFGSVQHNGPVAGGSSYTENVSAALPGLTPGSYRVIVRSDILNTVAESNEGNNLSASLDNVAIDVQALPLDAAVNGTLATGQSVFYKISVGAGETVRVTLDGTGDDTGNELYLRYGTIPGRGVFDEAGNSPFEADQQAVIPTTQAGTYYVMVHSATGSGTRPYSIRAEVLPFSLQSVDDTTIGDAGEVTLQVDGAKFDADTVFHLVNAAGATLTAERVQLENSSRAFVTFDARGAALGSYALVAVAGNDDEAVLATPIVIGEGEGAEVVARIDGPAQVRPGRVILANLNYANEGDADTMSPLFIVTSPTNTQFGSTVDTIGLSSSLQLLGVPSSGPQSALRAGEENSLPLLFKSVNAPMRFTVRTIEANSTEAIDFDLLNASLRTPGMSDADWNARWLTQIQPRLGETWGDYVHLVNALSERFSTDGHVISDVRELFKLAFTEDPGFVASTSYSATLRDAVSGDALAGIAVAAYRQTADGGYTLAKSGMTDASGNFTLRYLQPGTYVLAVARPVVGEDGQTELSADFFFDQNRNGLEDADSARFTLTEGDLAGDTLYVAEYPPEQPVAGPNDAAPVISTDSAGRAHMVWLREGQVWHAVNEGSGWTQGAPISDAQAYDLKLVIDPKLINGTSEGLLVAWRSGEGNDTEIWYAVGERIADGSYHWTAPAKVTDNTQFDGAYSVGVGTDGKPAFMWQREDAAIEDDLDLYSTELQIIDPVFASSLVQQYADLADALSLLSDAELEELGIHRIRFSRNLGDVSFGPLGTFNADIRLDGQAQIDCTLIYRMNGALKLKLGTLGEFEGVAGGDVRYQVNKDLCVYEFKNARFNFGVSGALNIPLTFIPVVGAALESAGVRGRVEGSFGGSMIWDEGADFPGWWSRGQGNLRFSLGVNIEKKVSFLGQSLTITGRVLGNANGTFDERGLRGANPTFSISAMVRIETVILGKKSYVDWTGTWPATDVGPLDASLITEQDALGTLSSYDSTMTWGISDDPVIGTHNIYLDAGEANLTENLYDEDTPSITEDLDGGLHAGWASEQGVLVSARSGGAWQSPELIPGTGGTQYANSGVTLSVDGNGDLLAVWTRLDASGLTSGATSAQIEAILNRGGDLVFARRDAATGQWTTPAVLSAQEGREGNVRLLRTADGGIAAAWTNGSLADQTGQGQIQAAFWNASSKTWSTPQVVASGRVTSSQPSLMQLGGQLTLVWTQGTGSGMSVTGHMMSSTWSGAGWSQGTALSIAMSTLLIDVQDTVQTPDTGALPDCGCGHIGPDNTQYDNITASDTELVLSGLPLPAVPEHCCDDDKDPPPYDPQPVVPRDPNDILGPQGFGDEHWVAATDTLGYTVRFENASDAAAPAQEVVITQQLDADLDWRTFRVDDFGFGDQRVELDAKNAFYSKRIDLSATKGYLLDVSVAIDVTTGIVTWKFTTIDPATGELPLDAQLGFLPPNKDADGVEDGRGEGFVSYTVKAKRTVTTGTVVDAEARIVFDTEEPIDTPPIFHTLDAGLPTSEVSVLPAETEEPTFLVQWSGADADGGSALRDYTIWVSTDGEAFEEWLTGTTLGESLFEGERGHTYAFFSVARDNAGNVELAPATADTATAVSPGTGTVSGIVFEDVDGDGTRDAGDSGLSGWTVFIDADADGVLDAGERSEVTLADGSYAFSGVRAGTVTVGRVLQDGWATTAPADNRQVVQVVAGETAGGASFGSFQLGNISGIKFDDSNGNGQRDSGEAGLAGWTIQLDRNADGSIDATAVTGADGSYSFANLTAGDYRVTEVAQAGWLQTRPSAGSYSVAVTSGLTAGGRHFGDVRAASIAGLKFEDVNGNGQRDSGENGLSGWTIFLDDNANGTLDGGERSTVTGSDGSYRFDDLLPGSYTVAEVMQSGWMQTSPAASTGSASLDALQLTGSGQLLQLPDAGLATSALETAAVSGNGSADLITGLDAFRHDSRFTGIDGSGVSVVVIDTGIDVDHRFFGPDANGDGVADRIVYQYDFAEGDADASDHNNHGSHTASLIGSSDATYGGVASGVDLISLKVFQDDGKGYFAYLERALQWVVANADGFNVGVVNLSLGDGGNWDAAIGRYGLGDELAALAAKNIIVTAASGNNYAKVGGAWGVSYPAADPAVLAVGATWTGDLGGPWTFSTGSTDYTTAADRIAAFSQRDDELLDIFAPGARLVGASATGGTTTMQGTSQASAYMAGVAALAQDLAQDHLGRRLSLAEFSALLDATADRIVDGDDENDNVRNSGLSFGRVDVQALGAAILAMQPGSGGGTGGGGTGTGTDPGTTPTQPSAGPAVHSITVAEGESASGADFGNFRLGRIDGQLIHDLDADGIADAGESGAGLGGFSVFLDANDNGIADVGEQAATTSANGQFSFTDLGPGTRRVVLADQAGWKTVVGEVTITITSGLAAAPLLAVNALPQFDELPGRALEEGQQLSADLSAFAHDNTGDVLHYELVTGPAGATVDASTGALAWTAAGTGAQTFTVRLTDSAGSVVERSFSVQVTPSALQVTAFEATNTGFKVRFNQAVDASRLNIYDAASYALGASDIVLRTSTGQVVAGSVVLDADGKGLSFVKTGGLLAAGNYTLQLASGANAFTTAGGKLLDGNGDGTGGDAYARAFGITGGGATLAIGEIARGPGQAINLPATGTGLPITLANAAGATRVEFTLHYDAALMNVSGVINGAGLPAGSTLSADLSVAGQVKVSVVLGAPLGAGVVELVRLQAAVPFGVPYGARQVLDLRDVSVNDGAIAVRDDDGLHVVAYIGDTNGSQSYSTLDVQRLQRVVTQADSGFGAYPLVDPTVIGDVNASGNLTSLDATRLQQKVTGVDRPEIPDIPVQPTAAALTLSSASSATLSTGAGISDLRLAATPAVEPPRAASTPVRQGGSVQLQPGASIDLAAGYTDFNLGGAADQAQWLEEWLGNGQTAQQQVKAKGRVLPAIRLTPAPR